MGKYGVRVGDHGNGIIIFKTRTEREQLLRLINQSLVPVDIKLFDADKAVEAKKEAAQESGQ